MKNIIFIIYTALFLAACGGSSSSTTNTPNNSDNSESVSKIGVFIDAPVKGLVYVSSPSGKEGVTNEKGEFEYIDGDTVSFNMGSIELGKAVPDKDKNVKVTQLKEALLVAQLLQVLDADADENKIDVSDIIIPEVIQKVIVEKLKRTENQTEDNIISKEQFEAIKQKNPKKLTLQQRTEVISKNKVLEHVKQQIGESDLRFSASELKSLILIEASLLNNFDGITIGFSDENSPAIQIDVKNNLVAKSISAKMSRSEWEIDSKGNLVVGPSGSACVVSKIAEDSDVMDVSYSCVDEKNNLGLSRLVKPQPLSANDLSDKSFNFTSPSGNKETLTFRNDGALNCNGENSSCTYKTHPIHKNAVWIQGGGDNSDENTLMILAQGSLAKGKLLIIHYDAQYNLDSVEVIKVSGNTLKQVFESADNDESSELNNNTDDNSDSNDNSESDKQNNEIEEAKEEAKEIEDPKEDDNEGTDNDSDSQTQNPNYIPFTQEMLSGKTFYGPHARDPITFYYGANNKGQGYFGLNSDSDYVIENPSVTFDYHIDSDGFLIFTNVSINDNSSTMGLIESSDKVIKVCWDSRSKYDMNDYCSPSHLKTFYTNFLEAEDAQIELERGNGIEEAKEEAKEIKDPKEEDNSDSDTQKSTYIPFTQEMLTNKYFYDTQFSQYNLSLTLLFGADQEGQASYGIYDQIDANDIAFSYDIDAEGYLTLSNMQGLSAGIPTNYFIGLLDIFDHGLNVCFGITKSNLEDQCKSGKITVLYNTVDAVNEKLDPKPVIEPTIYIPFTQEMLSGKTFYNLFPDQDDEDNDGSNTDHVAITISVDESNRGIGKYGLHDIITTPEATFNSSINDKGFWVLSYPDGQTDVYGLIKENENLLKVCKVSSQVDNLCNNDQYEFFYKDKENTKRLLDFLDRKDNEKRDGEENKDTDENSENNSDSGTQKPTYIPFTQEMISGKTLYSTYMDLDDEDNDGSKTDWIAVTFSFNQSSNSGEAVFGISAGIKTADVNFDYSIDDNGYLIFSNVIFSNPNDNPDDDDHSSDAIGVIAETEEYFIVCWDDSNKVSSGCNSDIAFFYKSKTAAEAGLAARALNALPISTYNHLGPGIQNPTYIPFTREMLAGKKFFNVAKVDNDQDYTLIFEYNNVGGLWFHLANLPDKPTSDTPRPDIIFDYMIDSHGYIVLSNVQGKGDLTDETPAIGLLGMENNSPIICWGDSASNITNFCKEDDQNVWYLTKEAADAEKVALEERIWEGEENTKNSEPVPYIPFTQEILSGQTFYDVGKDEKLTLFFGNDNKGHLWSGLTDGTPSPDIEFEYRVDSEGFIVLSNVFSNGSRSDDTPMIIGLLGKGVRGHSLVTCWGKSASEVTDFCGEDNKHVWYFTRQMAEAEVRAHGTVKDDGPKPIPVTYIPFTQGMLSGQTLYGVGNDLDVTINFEADNTGHATTQITHRYIPEDNDYDYITFDYLIDSHGLLILQNTKINGRDQTDTILGLIESSDGLKVCWGDEFMYKNKTSGFCMDEDIVALYRTKQLALNAQLKRDLPPSEKDKENTDKNSDSSMQTPTYIPFRQEMLSGKILYVPSAKLPLTMYYGDNNKGHGQISISNDNDYVMEEYPFVTFDYHIDSDGFLIYSDVSITDDRSTIGLIESSDKTLKVCWDDEQSYDINDFCKDEDLMTFYTNYIEAEVAQLSKDNQAYLEEVKTRTSIPFTQDMLSGKHFYDIHFGPKYHEMTLFFDADQTGKGVNGLHEQIEDEDMTFDYTIDKDGHLTLSNIKILRNSILYFVDITDVTYQYSIALNKDMHGQLLVCWGKSKSELVHPYGCMHGGQLKYLYKTVESAKEALENQ